MDFNDGRDDLADDGGVTVHRERAAAKIEQIAQQTKQMLAEAGIDIDVFFLIPSSGDSVVIFGTPADPSDDLWNKVRDVVVAVVRQSVGLDRPRCRTVTCATTHSIADHQPAPMSTPALQHAGAEVR